jgi:murein DD-endopeptidase MepM/ murein hydrolase activator NlpD
MIRRRHRALIGGFLLAVLALGSTVTLRGLWFDPSAAVPDLNVSDQTSGLLLVRGEPPGSEQRAQEDRQEPLNQVLDETRAMLEELIEAKAADRELRNELQALKRDNHRLVVELGQASIRRIELQRSSELAEARIAELTKAVDTVRREAAHIDEELTRLCWQNGQLNQSLARADATRKAALAEAERARFGMAKKLEAASHAAAQSEADLAGLFKELEAKDQALAAANSAREEVGARVRQAEETVAKSVAADLERRKKELAAVTEQLGNATSAAIEAERARQAASNEAERLRTEAERARDDLRAVSTEIASLKTANADLEKKLFSWRTSWMTAREQAVATGESIEEVNPALSSAPPAQAVPAPNPQPNPALFEPAAGPGAGPVPGPDGERHTVRSGETMSAIALRHTGAPPLRGDEFLWPVNGNVIGAFGPIDQWRRRDGIDIAAPRGAPVLAAQAGIVAYAGDGIRGYGQMILLRHEQGYLTTYAHNTTLLVDLGDVVERGQVIARVGDTGDAAQSMLHIQLRHGRTPIDPETRLVHGTTSLASTAESTSVE